MDKNHQQNIIALFWISRVRNSDTKFLAQKSSRVILSLTSLSVVFCYEANKTYFHNVFCYVDYI